jgi:hypothetical protein
MEAGVVNGAAWSAVRSGDVRRPGRSRSCTFDIIGGGDKHVQLLLEYFDTDRLTRRVDAYAS